MNWWSRMRKLFTPVAPSPAYQRAVHATDELIGRMREASASPDPVRALLADIWQQRYNIPYQVTLYEANQEMKMATELGKQVAKKN